jgi:hypothetical protein
MGTGLMSNPLFLQYMSALGAGIAGGNNPAVNAMNQVTQQGIAAQNMAKLIPKISAMLSGQTLPPPAQSVGGITATQPSNQKTSGILSALNPSVSSAISGADLAGLNPADISGALGGAINIEAFKQQREKDWLSTVNPTDKESYYQMFIDKPKYFEMERELRRAGATTIDEKLAVTEGSKKIEQEAYVKSPTLFRDVESDLQKDAQGWYTISSEVTNNPKYANTPRKDLVEIDHKLKILKETNNRIKQVYGDRVVVKPDGWYVGKKLIQRNPYYDK